MRVRRRREQRRRDGAADELSCVRRRRAGGDAASARARYTARVDVRLAAAVCCLKFKDDCRVIYEKLLG